MKIYKKKNIMAGTDLEKLSFSKILEIAKARPIGCISAITDEISKEPEKRVEMTKRLESDIASSFDYITVLGGWVEPVEDTNGLSEHEQAIGGKETTEESFIVIGDKYDDYDESLKVFKKIMFNLCKSYHQWSVLIIDTVYEDNLTKEMQNRRMDSYREFSHPDYADSEFDKDEYKRQSKLNKIINKTENLDLMQLHAAYYDGNGNMQDEFYNVSPRQIGYYFTQIGEQATGERFTLLATTLVRPRYFTIPNAIYAYRNLMNPSQRVVALNRFINQDDYEEHCIVASKRYGLI